MSALATDKNRIVRLCIAFVITLALTGCGASGNVTETHIEATYTYEDTAALSDAGVQSEAEASADEENGDAYPAINPALALSVPTQITKIGDFWFIVDCYNDQVIYSDSLDKPLNEWFIMTNDISRGHTVASDGEVYLVDDTENHRVLVFEYNGTSFINTQVFEGIGTRPHYIVYNEADKCFYVWSSMTGEMYVFEREDLLSDNTDKVDGQGETKAGNGSDVGSSKTDPGENEVREYKGVYISRIMKIDELDGIYVRSFTIDGDRAYLVSGNSQIIEARLSDFKILKRYAVPPELAGMIQIMPVTGGYYITISTDVNGNQDFATIIYTAALSDLEKGQYTDIYSYFVGGGTPYYMGFVDGRYYLTEHRLPGHSIWSFDIGEDHMPADVVSVY